MRPLALVASPGVLALALVGGIAACGDLDPAHDVPETVARLTMTEMIESIRANGSNSILLKPGMTIEVTGEVDRALVRPRTGIPRVVLITPAYRGFTSFGLDPSVDLDALTAGLTVTLRCNVDNRGLHRAQCLVIDPA